MNHALFQTHAEKSQRILYTPGSFAKKNLTYLQEAGKLQSLQTHISKREHLNSYLFFLVENGSGSLVYQQKTVQLNAGDCVFIDCQKPYQHQCTMKLWKLQWIHFYGAQTSEIYEQYLLLGGKNCFTAKDFTLYKQLLHEIYETATVESTLHDLELNEKFSRLFYLLIKEATQQHEKQTYKKGSLKNLEPVADYLKRHFQEKITLDTLSCQFYINKFYLTRIFKEQFGMSINHYLIQLRISHAKKLLRFTQLPIEEIARQSGIQDASYFNRLFHKIEGTSPGTYRKMWD